MKMIGLIGGMSWKSATVYYKLINEFVNEKYDVKHSCKCLMYSVDFIIISELQHKGNWKKLSEIMSDIAMSLEKGGAEMIVICSNTMHFLAPDIERHIQIPLIHIIDAVAVKIKESNMKKTAFLGTKFIMEKDFYRNRLNEKHGIEVLVPFGNDIDIIHRIIFNELIHGEIKNESRKNYKKIINKLVEKGAEGVILGCTEIPLLIDQKDCVVPVFDSTTIHAKIAVEMALKK